MASLIEIQCPRSIDIVLKYANVGKITILDTPRELYELLQDEKLREVAAKLSAPLLLGRYLDAGYPPLETWKVLSVISAMSPVYNTYLQCNEDDYYLLLDKMTEAVYTALDPTGINNRASSKIAYMFNSLLMRIRVKPLLLAFLKTPSDYRLKRLATRLFSERISKHIVDRIENDNLPEIQPNDIIALRNYIYAIFPYNRYTAIINNKQGWPIMTASMTKPYFLCTKKYFEEYLSNDGYKYLLYSISSEISEEKYATELGRYASMASKRTKYILWGTRCTTHVIREIYRMIGHPIITAFVLSYNNGINAKANNRMEYLIKKLARQETFALIQATRNKSARMPIKFKHIRAKIPFTEEYTTNFLYHYVFGGVEKTAQIDGIKNTPAAFILFHCAIPIDK